MTYFHLFCTMNTIVKGLTGQFIQSSRDIKFCINCRYSVASQFLRVNNGRRKTTLSPTMPQQVVYLINYIPQRNAGHSKWQNIRHVKQANDLARNREIGKFLNLLKAAVREHGSADPKKNGKLAQIIAQYKAAKLSMAPIERALQNYQNQKASSNCIYPIKGPGNCLMLLDLESPSLARTKQELNTVLKKNRGSIADESVLFLFEHKGVLLASEIDGKPVSADLLDDATMHAIEAGANDVEIEEDEEHGSVFEFTTAPTNFFKVKNALEELKYKFVEAEVAYVPKTLVELEDADVEAANKLYLKLSDHAEVQKIFVNIA